MYNVKSPHAEEFIDHEEVLASLKYADEHKSDAALIDSIIEKAKEPLRARQLPLRHRRVATRAAART